MTEQGNATYREAWQRRHGQRQDQDPGRARALEAFLARGLPGPREEDWRYTNLDAVRERSLAWLADAGSATGGEPARPLPPWEGPSLDFVDGQALSTDAGAWPTGLRLRVLESPEPGAAGGDHGAGDDLADPIRAWNRAFLDQTLAVSTVADAEPRQPLRISHRSSGLPVVSHARLHLSLAPRSSLSLFLHQDLGPAALATLVTDIRVGAGARLRLLRIQSSGDDVLQLEQTRVHLDQDATLELTTLDLGGRLVRHDLAVSLDGPGASASLAGLFLADGRRHVDNHTRLDHRSPRTTSEEHFRGVLDGSGRGVFNGRIVVHPGAAGTSAALTNRNLLLSRTAEIDTKPELEISVDDVKCSHGATTGQLDPAALFYLQSRGIGQDDARQILVRAFAMEILAHIPVPAARELAAAALDRHLVEGPPGHLAGASP